MAEDEKRRGDILDMLTATIAERASASAESSYTASLLQAGTDKCAQKVGEEAVEFVIAAVSGAREETRKEAADLVYHLLVALESSGVSLHEVLEELGRRQGISGHVEKASRTSETQG